MNPESTTESTTKTPEIPQLLPAILPILDRFQVTTPIDDPPYRPSSAMRAGMMAIRDISQALADRMGQDDFWDGGDDIDYTQAAGEVIDILCTALSSEYDDHAMTLLLNRIASFIPNLEDAPHDDLDDALSTAGNGGFASPLLDAIVECAHQPTP